MRVAVHQQVKVGSADEGQKGVMVQSSLSVQTGYSAIEMRVLALFESYVQRAAFLCHRSPVQRYSVPVKGKAYCALSDGHTTH